MCDVGLLSLEILPIEAALNLFICGPPSAKHSLSINLFNSMRERKYEMALIRTLGSSRRQLSMMIIFESLILTTVGFFIGLLVSRLGVMFVSSFMEESLNYNLKSFGILNEELWLLGLSIFIGLISSIIPALQVYNLNISETLADE